MGHDGSGVSALVGLGGFVVTAQLLDDASGEWWLAVETADDRAWCEICGVRAIGHGRRRVVVRDLPMADRPVVLVWAKRLWRCGEAACSARTWSEESGEIAPRAVLTERARAEICRLVGPGEHSVAQAARNFGVSWHAAMAAVRDHGRPRVDHLARLGAPSALGLDETSFLAATAEHPTLLVTGIIDIDEGRVVDVLAARSAVAVTDWLGSKPAPWLAGIRHVVIDPYQPYATAVAAGLPDARLVVDHFHVIRLANAALDEVRRRTQQATTGHRGRKDDPLYRIRRRLLARHEDLGPDGFAGVLAWLDAGDPDGEVGAAYLAKELLRETYLAADAFDARRRLAGFYDYCASSDVPELERLGRTIARWETPILRWHRTRLTNAATEGTNLIIKNIKRLGFGFRNFENYRLRLLLRCGAPWRGCCIDLPSGVLAFGPRRRHDRCRGVQLPGGRSRSAVLDAAEHGRVA
ncbi:MAG TPA: ISL3 family transposase, partial [Acidimicrobiales bacterium]|nr:ISL3 family transposase [Acidimicrobiales bacterium]